MDPKIVRRMQPGFGLASEVGWRQANVDHELVGVIGGTAQVRSIPGDSQISNACLRGVALHPGSSVVVRLQIERVGVPIYALQPHFIIAETVDNVFQGKAYI